MVFMSMGEMLRGFMSVVIIFNFVQQFILLFIFLIICPWGFLLNCYLYKKLILTTMIRQTRNRRLLQTFRRNWGSRSETSLARVLMEVQTLSSESQSCWPGALLLLTREQHTAFSRKYWNKKKKKTSHYSGVKHKTETLIFPRYKTFLSFSSSLAFLSPVSSSGNSSCPTTSELSSSWLLVSVSRTGNSTTGSASTSSSSFSSSHKE